ncbi:hypothetical protein BC332_30566 [Capsicum chinense]|nr:hypothetical protein BC332_30566 [Capsicum chinense]
MKKLKKVVSSRSKKSGSKASSKKKFDDSGRPRLLKTDRTDWSTLEAYKGRLGQRTGLISHNPFDVEYVQNIPQQSSDSLDCGVFVTAYTEILSEGQQVHSCDFDAGSQRARYASLLWHYGVTKAKKGYTSENNNPPRPRNSYLQSTDESAIVTLE